MCEKYNNERYGHKVKQEIKTRSVERLCENRMHWKGAIIRLNNILQWCPTNNIITNT